MGAWWKETTAYQEVMEACLESREPTSVEIKSVVVHDLSLKRRGRIENC
jgi:hypothetical protein